MKGKPLRSLAAFVESVAKFLRQEVRSGSLEKKQFNSSSSPAPKIERIARLLRDKVHELQKRK